MTSLVAYPCFLAFLWLLTTIISFLIAYMHLHLDLLLEFVATLTMITYGPPLHMPKPSCSLPLIFYLIGPTSDLLWVHGSRISQVLTINLRCTLVPSLSFPMVTFHLFWLVLLWKIWSYPMLYLKFFLKIVISYRRHLINFFTSDSFLLNT